MTQQKNDLPVEEKGKLVALVGAVLAAQPDDIELEMALPYGVRVNVNGSDLNAGTEDDEDADPDEDQDEDADEDEDEDGYDSDLSIRVAFPAPFTPFNAQVVFEFDSLEEMQEWAKN